MKKFTIFTWILICSLVTGLAVFQLTAEAQPGAAADPLVTQRYVTNRINEATTHLQSQINAMQSQINNLQTNLAVSGACNCPPGGAQPGGIFNQNVISCACPPISSISQWQCSSSAPGGSNLPPGSSAADPEMVPFTPLQIAAGYRIIMAAGAEVILRSGAATIISGANGLVNVTTGVDLQNGASVPMNNLLLVPATDGRGLHFTSNSWVMIRGDFAFVS